MPFYHRTTGTIFDETSDFVKKLTRCGTPEVLDLTEYDCLPVEYATLLDGQRHGEPVFETTRVLYPAVDLSHEELAELLIQRLGQIQQARRAWLDANIDPDGLQLAMMLYQQGSAKGAAIFNWCVQLGIASERRQAELMAEVVDWSEALCDFSMFAKPHTNAELMMEAGLT
jgi:hypothetical protein